MTPPLHLSIKEWIEKEAIKYSGTKKYNEITFRNGFESGLTKGIEYAIGFAEWVKVNVWQPYNDGRWVKYGESEVFTPSQLFIEYLKTINK